MYKMIYTCWACGRRINERTTNSKMIIYHWDIKPEDIGKYILYEHHPFCNSDCVEKYKNKPIRSLPADWYVDIWKAKRRHKNAS